MKYLYLFAIFSILFASVSYAQAYDISQIETSVVGKELPGIAGMLFGNERMNVYIDDGKYVFSIVTKDNVFQSLDSGLLDDPSLNIYTDEQTIREIAVSEDFLGEFKKAIDDKSIRYESVGIINSIKFGFVSLVSDLINFFS